MPLVRSAACPDGCSRAEIHVDRSAAFFVPPGAKAGIAANRWDDRPSSRLGLAPSTLHAFVAKLKTRPRGASRAAVARSAVCLKSCNGEAARRWNVPKRVVNWGAALEMSPCPGEHPPVVFELNAHLTTFAACRGSSSGCVSGEDAALAVNRGRRGV